MLQLVQNQTLYKFKEGLSLTCSILAMIKGGMYTFDASVKSLDLSLVNHIR